MRKADKEKSFLGMSRLASIPFSIFENCIRKNLSYVFSDLEVWYFKYLKRGSAKSCSRFFEIAKCAYLNIGKGR